MGGLSPAQPPGASPDRRTGGPAASGARRDLDHGVVAHPPHLPALAGAADEAPITLVHVVQPPIRGVEPPGLIRPAAAEGPVNAAHVVAFRFVGSRPATQSPRLRTDLSAGHLGAATDLPRPAPALWRSAACRVMEPTRGCVPGARTVSPRAVRLESGRIIMMIVLMRLCSSSSSRLTPWTSDRGPGPGTPARCVVHRGTLREGLEGRDHGLEEAAHVGASDDGPLDRWAVKDDVRAECGHHRLDVLGLQGAAEVMGPGHVRLQSGSTVSGSIVLLTAFPSAPEGAALRHRSCADTVAAGGPAHIGWVDHSGGRLAEWFRWTMQPDPGRAVIHIRRCADEYIDNMRVARVRPSSTPPSSHTTPAAFPAHGANQTRGNSVVALATGAPGTASPSFASPAISRGC